jgi:two-component system OmpR family sensor kinase
MWPPRSLQWRLGLLSAAVIAIALAATFAVVNVLVERALIDSTASRLEVEAGLIAPTNPGRGNARATSLAAGDLAALLGGQTTAVAILDPSGVTLASQANGADPAVVDARLEATAYAGILAGGGPTDAVVAAPGLSGGRVLVVAVPIRFASAGPPAVTAPAASAGPSAPPSESAGPGKGHGQGNGNGKGNGNGNGRGLGLGGTGTQDGPPNAIAQLSISLGDVDATLASLRATLLLVAIAALVVAIPVIFLMTSVGLRPLARVAAVADRVASGDLTARTGLPSGGDEIGRLGRAVDRMVGRLEASFRAQRQFAADASHELRSPLTVLGGYVDVLAAGAHEAPDAAARILGSMRREIDRLSRLAADLLLLTQLEAGGGRLDPDHLDVGDILTDLAEAARVIGPDRRVFVDLGGPLPVVADRDRLTQAFLNLVDNAVRHAPAGGLVRLSGRRDAGTIVAAVHNTGASIPAEHLPRLFDRFYRSDRSIEPGRHAGLGLAIVKAIVEASDGTVEVASDASGVTFVVRLPVDPAAPSEPATSGRAVQLPNAPLP